MNALKVLQIICNLAFATTASDAFSQPVDYPARPVTVVVPFAAGGGTDSIARLVGQKLSERYAKPFVVENRLGAGGNIAGAAVAKASADGHTLLMATSGVLSTNVSLYKNLSYDPTKELVPVALVCAVPFVLVVHPSFPVSTVADLVKAAKERPGKISFASGGVGTFHHMMGELLKNSAGIDIVHVPYKGGAPAVNDVVAGHVPMMFGELPAVIQLIEDGKLRALGITTAEPAPSAPKIPPLARSGLPGFDAAAWQMIAAPAGTPKAILEKLNADINLLIADPDVTRSIVKLGFNPIGRGDLKTLDAYVKSETLRWKDLISRSGFAGLE